LKSTNASIIKEIKPTDRALDKSKEMLNILHNEDLNISNEMRVVNTQPSKEIEYQLPEKNERLGENDISQIKKSFKNLEDHLMDFWREKSSRETTPKRLTAPKMEERKLDVLPEQFNFASNENPIKPDEELPVIQA
jgi:hypothetical protein